MALIEGAGLTGHGFWLWVGLLSTPHVFFLGCRLKGQQLPREAVLLVPAEAQEDKPTGANTFQTSVCVMSANIPLAKSGHMAAPKGSGKYIPPTMKPKQIMWPKSVGQGRIYSSHGGEGGREGICFRIMESTHILNICWDTRFFEIQMKSAQNSPGQCYHPISPGNL